MTTPSQAPAEEEFPRADTKYWWFDRMYRRIENSDWLEVQINRKERFCWIQGSKIPFTWLCHSIQDAVRDGIDYYRREIAERELAITRLESDLETWQLRHSKTD